MALDTGLLACPILIVILGMSPSTGMRACPATLVALDTNIAIRVASLAGLQIAPGLARMIGKLHAVYSRFTHKVRFYPHLTNRELSVAVVAVGRLMAPVAALGIVQGLDGVDAEEVRAVALRDVVALEGTRGQVPIDTPAGVAVETPGLGVALGAITPRLARQNPVAAYPVTVMVRCDPFSLVAAGAVSKGH